MTGSGRNAQRGRYHDWCVRQCLRHCTAIASSIEKQPANQVPTCVVTSIALFEMGARSVFERWSERIIYRTGVVFALLGLLPGVPDISIGPFQMRPSTAFQWERKRVLFGHVARPPDGVDPKSLGRADELLQVAAAAELLVAVLTAQAGRETGCASLATVYSAYRGHDLKSSETDYKVLAGVHSALHLPSTSRQP